MNGYKLSKGASGAGCSAAHNTAPERLRTCNDNSTAAQRRTARGKAPGTPSDAPSDVYACVQQSRIYIQPANSDVSPIIWHMADAP